MPKTQSFAAHPGEHHRRSPFAAIGLAAIAGALSFFTAFAQEAGLTSPWMTEHAARVRLVAGGIPAQNGEPQRLLAGLEIELDQGWKTYWRNPGSSGVPPRLDFSGSKNLVEANPLFPAPQRFVDRDGDTIGYKTAVVLPIAIKPADPKQAVTLNLSLELGVCKDVCIPVQQSLSLVLLPDAASRPVGSATQAALDNVPRLHAQRRHNDPELKIVKIELKGPKPHILLEALFAGDTEAADIFLEAPDSIWIPIPKRDGDVKGGIGRFLVDLTEGADLNDLRGRLIRATLVSASGQTETSFKLE